jgi:hypothetical protein
MNRVTLTRFSGPLTLKTQILFSEVDAEAVAGGVGEGLADAEGAFGGEDGVVAERELDLFKGGGAAVSELGEGAP